MVAAMCIRQDLPRTSQCKSWNRDGKIYCRRWVDHMLGLWFEIGVGSVIENTQIVFICESLNDFTPGINIMTAPQIIVYIEVTHDKSLASDISHQMWQISGGEMAVARDVYRKDSDRSTTQCELNCYRLEVRVYLDQLVVESFLDIDWNSSTRQLVQISSQWLKIAVIIGTSIVTQGWGMLQFGFLQAYNIWLMLMNQDIKVPSVTSQTPNVPLQYRSHYDLFGLVEIFLFFRSPAGFVIGDVTGALFAPFLFSSTFFLGVGSWFGTYEGPFVGLLVLSIWDGDTLAYGPDALQSPVCEATLALETASVGISHRVQVVSIAHRCVVGTSHRGGVLDTIYRGVRVGTSHQRFLWSVRSMGAFHIKRCVGLSHKGLQEMNYSL